MVDRPIDLARAERGERLRDVVPAECKEPFGAYVLAGSDERCAPVRELEEEVFLEAFGNTAEMLADEYERFAGASVFVGVVDHRRFIVAGAMRLILPSPDGLKSWDDAADVWSCDPGVLLGEGGKRADPADFWDIATVAVRSDYRRGALRGLVSMTLYQAYSLMAHDAGVDRAVAILDLPVFRLLQGNLKRPLTPFPGLGPRPYLGSDASLPVSLDMAVYLERLRSEDPFLYGVGTEGIGLEDAVRPPDRDRAAEVIGSLSRL